MAEGDLTDFPGNEVADDVSLTPERPVEQTPRATMSEDTASLKAFSYAELTSRNSTPAMKQETYTRVRDSLMLMGKSDEVDSYEETITNIRQMDFGQGVVNQLAAGRFNEDEGLVQLKDAVSAGKLSVEDALLIQSGEHAQAEPELLADEINFLKEPFDYGTFVRQRRDERTEVDLALAPMVAELDPSYRSLLGDFLAEAIPFAGVSLFASKLAAELEGQQGGSFTDRTFARIRGFVAVGEVRNDIRELVQRVHPSDRPELARQLAKAVRRKSGIIFDNDTQTIDWLETVISTADEDRSGTDWDRILYNSITLLDAVPFLTRALRGGSLAVSTWFSKAAKVNRMKARDFLKEAASNPGASKTMIISPEELATGQLPKSSIKDVDSTPSILMDLRANDANQVELVRGVDNTAINFTSDEVNAVADRLRSAYQSINGGHVVPNKLVIDVSQGDRVVSEAILARTANEGGWKTTLGALRAAEKATDGDLTKARLMARKPDGGFEAVATGPEMKKLATGRSTGEEYFVQLRDTHFLNETDVMAFGGNPVFATGPFGSGRYLMDASSQFTKEAWMPAYAAMGREQEFIRSAINVADQYWKLSRGSRNRVTRLIEKGASPDNPKQFTPDELVAMEPNITVGEVKGYYAFRQANDAVWAAANQRVYKEMQGAGYRALEGPKERYIVRDLRPNDGTPVRAFNPKTNKIENVSESQLKSLRDGGGDVRVLHNNDSIVKKGEDTLFVIDDGKATKLGPLPRMLLKYEPGYVARLYKDNFFVTVTEKMKRNGADHDVLKTVRSARTQKEAEEVAAELTASTGIKHEWRDVALDSNYSKVVNDTLLLEQDRLVYGNRVRDPIQRQDGTVGPLVDPVEALHRSVNAVARSIGIEDYVRIQERKFIQTYEDVVSPTVWADYTKARFGPKAVTDDLSVAANSSGPKAKKAQEALQLWKYYQMLRGTAPPASVRYWRAAVRRLAYKAEQLTTSRTVAEMVQKAAFTDPFSATKGLVFTTLISANPFRQIALQTMQFLYMVGANPNIALRAIGHAPVVRLGMKRINTPDWENWRRAMSKTLKISEDEVETMVLQFKRSGLVAEIDSYGYIGAQMTEPNFSYTPSVLGQAGQIAGNAIKTPFNIAKKMGFNAGEMNNLSMTWTFALKDYLKKNKKQIRDLTQKEWQEIGAQASGYALGMHKAGTFAYQQGFLSTLTQFWSIMHKATAGMLPGKFGSKAFSNQQKAGIIAFQVSMYGAAGLGIEEQVRDIFAATHVLDGVDEETARNTVRIVSSGMAEMLLNHIMSESDGEDVDISFSSSFAPAGAGVSTFTDFVQSLIHFGSLDTVIKSTAAGSTLGRYSDMAKYIRYTLAMEDTVPNTPDKLERIMTVTPTVFSGWSNAVKAFYALRTGQLVTQYGDARSEVTYSEAVMRGLFGLATNEEEDLRRLYNLDGKGFVFDQNKAEEIAGSIYKAMTKNLLAFEGRGLEGYSRLAADFEGERVILEILDESEKEQVHMAFNKIAARSRGTPEDVFKLLYDKAFEGASPVERVYSEVRTNMFAEKYADQRDILLELLKDMLEGRNERMDYYQERNMRLPEQYPYLIEDDE